MENLLSRVWEHFSLLLMVLCLPFILKAVCEVLPTFDDYTSLQSPWWVQIADPGFFFPDAVRRPFDALLGYVVGCHPSLFPTLNHVLIILGHTASALLVFLLCRRLGLGLMAANIATLFFFFSPATLGATLACDGFNQTYAQLWGLLSLLAYLHDRSKVLWLACVVMAVLSKENGLAWAVIPPLVGYAFGRCHRRETLLDVGKGLLIGVAYIALYATLAATGFLEYADEYTEASLLSHTKDLAQLLAYTWLPIDYVSAVYAPMRNWIVVGLTLALAVPFLAVLAGGWRLLKERTLPLLVVCFFILVAPHLLTLVSIMHNYAALSVAALIVAFIVSHTGNRRYVVPAFVLFLTAALFTDIHHYQAARQSGLLGRQLAMQAIECAEKAPQRAMVISIDDPSEPHYSSFCVRPSDAFAWGLSVLYYTGFNWNTQLTGCTLDHNDPVRIKAEADSALNEGYEVVWVVGTHPDRLEVIKLKN